MWELDYKESWVPKNWCFWAVVLKKTLESPLDCKEIQPVHSKGDQSWVFIGRTDVEAETSILWPPDAKSWLIWEDSDAGKDWRQEETEMTEDVTVGWHHQFDGHEFEQALGWWQRAKPGMLQSKGSQRVEHDWETELNWTELNPPITSHTPIFRYHHIQGQSCNRRILWGTWRVSQHMPASTWVSSQTLNLATTSCHSSTDVRWRLHRGFGETDFPSLWQ